MWGHSSALASACGMLIYHTSWFWGWRFSQAGLQKSSTNILVRCLLGLFAKWVWLFGFYVFFVKLGVDPLGMLIGLILAVSIHIFFYSFVRLG
jgi:hypothetical protein